MLPKWTASYLIVFGFDVANDFAPVSGFAGDFTEDTFASLIHAFVVGHFNYFVFDAVEFFVEVPEAFTVFVQFVFANAFVNGPSYFLD